MKSVKNVLAVVCFFIAANFVNAAELNTIKKPESAQIQTMLNTINFQNFIESETKINISFFINAQNEVIVVSTNNLDLDSIVKNTLNYKKIAVNELEYNKVYTVPVLIK